MKRILSSVIVIVILLTSVSLPSFSAGENHTRLTHLNATNVIKTDVDARPFSDLNRLFDGDSSASHAESPSSTPDGNGLFAETWRGAGEKRYITIDLGDVYELSQINTYWGWAPQAFPGWNNWEYDVPSSYKIYISETEEGLFNALPAAEVTGLSKNSKYIADSFASVSAVGRYVKIVSTVTTGRYALREIEFIGALSPRISTLGANIRLESDELSAGIRFGATIDKALLDVEGEWKYSPDSNTEFGMYLLPANKLEAGQTLAEYLRDGGKDALKIVAKNILAQDKTTITYTAVLIDIPKSEYNRNIVAIPYVTSENITTYY